MLLPKSLGSNNFKFLNPILKISQILRELSYQYSRTTYLFTDPPITYIYWAVREGQGQIGWPGQ
jgi:hypothetical protein